MELGQEDMKDGATKREQRERDPETLKIYTTGQARRQTQT